MIYFVPFTRHEMIKATFLILLFISFFCGTAQPTDTALVRQAVESTIGFYSAAISGHSLLYLGSEYRESRMTPEQHPFFVSEDWIEGSVTYRGQHFDRVPLLYDITSDRVITENYYSAQQIALVNEKVTEFHFGPRYFKNIKKEGRFAALPAPGFYEVVYDGPTSVLARHVKNVREEIVSHEIKTFYEEKSRYFLLKHDRYFSVRNKASLLRVLGDKKSALKHMIKKEKLKFRADPIRLLQRAALLYDTQNGAR